VSAEAHGWGEGASHSIEEGRAAIDPLQFRAREVRRHRTETLTIGHRRTDVRGETAALRGNLLHSDFWRIKTRARSGWHEAEPNLPLGIVHIEVHQHHGLPCAECGATPKHGKGDRGADERGEHVVSPMTLRAVSMLISIITRQQSVQSIF
jgi:hypothetical protein